MPLNEIVIISGKGGTGKTSITASLASLSGRSVIVDCDVDASDLHLALPHENLSAEPFTSGWIAVRNAEACNGCALCIDRCHFSAIDASFTISRIACEGCGVCADHCPEEAIRMDTRTSGEWYKSESPYGPFLHARLLPGEGNSGKLVACLKTEARRIAAERGIERVIVDGSPGIGCPVISSFAGASAVLIVAEATVSGIHDLKRIYDLASRFRLPSQVCINRCGISPAHESSIESWCRDMNVPLAAKIPDDPAVTGAQIAGIPLVEHSDGPAARAVKALFDKIIGRCVHEKK